MNFKKINENTILKDKNGWNCRNWNEGNDLLWKASTKNILAMLSDTDIEYSHIACIRLIKPSLQYSSDNEFIKIAEKASFIIIKKLKHIKGILEERYKECFPSKELPKYHLPKCRERLLSSNIEQEGIAYTDYVNTAYMKYLAEEIIKKEKKE